jgi:hypothetical protein
MSCVPEANLLRVWNLNLSTLPTMLPVGIWNLKIEELLLRSTNTLPIGWSAGTLPSRPRRIGGAALYLLVEIRLVLSYAMIYDAAAAGLDLLEDLKLIETIGIRPVKPGSEMATTVYRVLLEPVGDPIGNLPTPHM